MTAELCKEYKIAHNRNGLYALDKRIISSLAYRDKQVLSKISPNEQWRCAKFVLEALENVGIVKVDQKETEKGVKEFFSLTEKGKEFWSKYNAN